MMIRMAAGATRRSSHSHTVNSMPGCQPSSPSRSARFMRQPANSAISAPPSGIMIVAVR